MIGMSCVNIMIVCDSYHNLTSMHCQNGCQICSRISEPPTEVRPDYLKHNFLSLLLLTINPHITYLKCQLNTKPLLLGTPSPNSHHHRTPKLQAFCKDSAFPILKIICTDANPCRDRSNTPRRIRSTQHHKCLAERRSKS